MKRIAQTLIVSAFALMITIPSFAQNGKAYGKKFKAQNAFPAAELNERMNDKDQLEHVVLSGEITQVCQAEGCWMKMKNAEGDDIFVKFNDHAFVIPKDLAGHKAYVHGTAVRKIVSVEDQRHFAEDAGKTEEEIAQIKEPKVELRVNATGVIIE